MEQQRSNGGRLFGDRINGNRETRDWTGMEDCTINEEGKKERKQTRKISQSAAAVSDSGRSCHIFAMLFNFVLYFCDFGLREGTGEEEKSSLAL